MQSSGLRNSNWNESTIRHINYISTCICTYSLTKYRKSTEHWFHSHWLSNVRAPSALWSAPAIALKISGTVERERERERQREKGSQAKSGDEDMDNISRCSKCTCRHLRVASRQVSRCGHIAKNIPRVNTLTYIYVHPSYTIYTYILRSPHKSNRSTIGT